MGLDISAYYGLTKSKNQDEDSDGAFLFENNTIFNQSGGLNGYYEYTGQINFGAGSYSGYGTWRRLLASMIGYNDIESLWDSLNKSYNRNESLNLVLDESDGIDYSPIPFAELIYFSDCEGVIAGEVASKLYNDFVNNKENADKYSEQLSNTTTAYSGQSFIRLYDEFTKAFKIASEGGCVCFH